jgi:hypothetical protein
MSGPAAPLLACLGALLLATCGGETSEGMAGRIVFSSGRDGDFDIYVMSGDGGRVEQLTTNESSGTNEADDLARSPTTRPGT